jgi:hypothetical protein
VTYVFPPPDRGPLVGEAACCFAASWQVFLRGLLLLDQAGLEPTDEMRDLVEELARVPDAIIELADTIGHEGARA